jgi:hypothetical protein
MKTNECNMSRKLLQHQYTTIATSKKQCREGEEPSAPRARRRWGHHRRSSITPCCRASPAPPARNPTPGAPIRHRRAPPPRPVRRQTSTPPPAAGSPGAGDGGGRREAGARLARSRWRVSYGPPWPTTLVGTRTDYSVGPWDYPACATRHLMAWSTRTTEEKYSDRKLYMSRTIWKTPRRTRLVLSPYSDL